MAYSEKVIQHYEKPKNVGSLDKKQKNIGFALVGSPSCGDVIQFYMEIDESNNTIKDAKFKTFGCMSAIASSSLMTEKVKGLTIEEALKVKNTDIAEELDLPPVKIHCSVLAEDAIRTAISDYKNKQSEE